MGLNAHTFNETGERMALRNFGFLVEEAMIFLTRKPKRRSNAKRLLLQNKVIYLNCPENGHKWDSGETAIMHATLKADDGATARRTAGACCCASRACSILNAIKC
jgi:hypothetical protein